MSHPKRDPAAVLHNDILGIPGGIAAAAKGIGRSVGVLYNKFSEANPHNELTGREERALAHFAQAATGSTAYAEAIAADFDGIFLPLPAGEAGEDDVLAAYLDIIQQMGALSQEFTSAREDGVVDSDEFASLRLRGYRSVRAIMHLLAELETMVRDVPARATLVKRVS
jgi:hypothetical protein